MCTFIKLRVAITKYSNNSYSPLKTFWLTILQGGVKLYCGSKILYCHSQCIKQSHLCPIHVCFAPIAARVTSFHFLSF